MAFRFAPLTYISGRADKCQRAGSYAKGPAIRFTHKRAGWLAYQYEYQRAGWRGWVGVVVGVVVGKVSLNPHIWVVHIVQLPYLYTLNPCGLNYMYACTRTNQKRGTASFCLYGDNKGKWSPKSALNHHLTPTHGVHW
jgi:hypothetical protein